MNPFVYIKFWRNLAYHLKLLFGFELSTVTPNLLQKLERCQMWFLKIIFLYQNLPQVHQFYSLQVSVQLNLKLILESFSSLAACWLNRNCLFQSRATSYFDTNIKSVGVLPSICDTLCKYNLFTYFETWFYSSIFHCYDEWK